MSGNSSDTDDYYYYEYSQVTLDVNNALGAILFFFGIIGNFFILIVFNGSKNMRSKPCAMLFTTLAIGDTVYLSTSLVRRWILFYTGAYVDIRMDSEPVWCKVHVYLTYASYMLSAWILVTISIERSLAIAIPMKHKIVCTRRNVGIVLGLVVVSVLAYNAHFAYGYCPMSEQYIIFYDTHAEMLDLILNVVIPFSVCSLSNIVIIICIRKSMNKRSEMASASNPEKGGKRKVESVTLMLIATNVMFIVTTLPFSIYLNQVELWQLEWDVALSLLSYANNGINFWIYCLSGQKFRREFAAVMARLCCCCCDSRGSVGKPSSSSTTTTTSS